MLDNKKDMGNQESQKPKKSQKTSPNTLSFHATTLLHKLFFLLGIPPLITSFLVFLWWSLHPPLQHRSKLVVVELICALHQRAHYLAPENFYTQYFDYLHSPFLISPGSSVHSIPMQLCVLIFCFVFKPVNSN